MKKITIIITLFLFINSNLAVQGLNFEKSTIQQVNTSENYDMVIIAPEHFSNSLLPLIDHKNSVGVETFVKTTEEIYEEYIGRDEAEQIKYCILDFIETYNIQYVLLIGDIETLPIRKTEVNHIWPSNDLIQIDDIITDLYYADIYDEFGNFSSWDSNNDGIFSEYYLYNLGENPDDVVIVDNTNIRWWEMENYIRIAKANGYKVIVYSCQPKTKFDLKHCMKRQTHGVPQGTILALWFEMEHPTEWPDGAMNLVDKTVMTFNPTVDQIKNGLKL